MKDRCRPPQGIPTFWNHLWRSSRIWCETTCHKPNYDKGLIYLPINYKKILIILLIVLHKQSLFTDQDHMLYKTLMEIKTCCVYLRIWVFQKKGVNYVSRACSLYPMCNIVIKLLIYMRFEVFNWNAGDHFNCIHAY